MNRLHEPLLSRTRTIRTLSNPQDASVGPVVSSAGLREPTTVKKFVKRTLNLKGSVAAAKTRGWERRPGKLVVPLTQSKDHNVNVFIPA